LQFGYAPLYTDPEGLLINLPARGKTMIQRSQVKRESKSIDKALLQQTVAALDERMGFTQDRKTTGEEVQALLRARGVQSDQRFLSSEILRTRSEQTEGR